MMRPIEPAMSCDARTRGCHVCGDEAVPGRVIEIDAADRTAVVEFESGRAVVALDFVSVGVGDAVLVHLGFAIQRLDVA